MSLALTSLVVKSFERLVKGQTVATGGRGTGAPFSLQIFQHVVLPVWTALSLPTVLSPSLYVLYTCDCRRQHGDGRILKFLLMTRLLSATSAKTYLVDGFLRWCDEAWFQEEGNQSACSDSYKRSCRVLSNIDIRLQSLIMTWNLTLIVKQSARRDSDACIV